MITNLELKQMKENVRTYCNHDLLGELTKFINKTELDERETIYKIEIIKEVDVRGMIPSLETK